MYIFQQFVKLDRNIDFEKKTNLQIALCGINLVINFKQDNQIIVTKIC